MTETELEEMLDELRRTANSVDPVPADVRAAALAAFPRRTIDTELAELVYDSWADDRALVGVRGGNGPRHLVFESVGLTVEVEIGEGGERAIVGQLVPPRTGTVEIRQKAGSFTTPADDLGRFTAEVRSAGPVSLLCRAHESSSVVVTDWVVV